MGNTHVYRDLEGAYHFFRRWDSGKGSLNSKSRDPEQLAMAMANSRSSFSTNYELIWELPEEARGGSVRLTDSQLDDVLILLKRELALPRRVSRMVQKKVSILSQRYHSFMDY